MPPPPEVVQHSGLYVDCGYCGLNFETVKELGEHEKEESHHEQFDACGKLLHECLLCAVTVTSASDFEGHTLGIVFISFSKKMTATRRKIIPADN